MEQIENVVKIHESGVTHVEFFIFILVFSNLIYFSFSKKEIIETYKELLKWMFKS